MSRRLILNFFLVAALLFSLPYFLLPAPQTSLSGVVSHSKTMNPSNYLAPVKLRDVSAQMNIHQSHRQSAEHISAISESLAAGVCVFDFDNDGWMDVFIVGGSGHSRHYGKKVWWGNSGGNRLLRNRQGKQFIDVSESAGIQKRHWGTSCAIADLDNDHDSDLVLTGYGENQVYENLGNGAFAERTSTSGIANSHWSTGAALADFNKDGLTDIYITNLVQFTKGRRTFEHQKGYATQAVSFSPQLYDAEENAFYLNKGNLTFDKVNSVASNRFGRSLTAKWHDINQDSWPDLVVLNDFATPNQIYLNHGGERFVVDTERPERLQQSGSRTLLIEDFFNQGALNYFLSRAQGSSNVLLEPKQGNKQNQFTYLDSSREHELASHHLVHKESWGAIALDINNDGWLDIYTTNGQARPDPDSFQIALAQQNDLYLNQGGQGFVRTPGEDQASFPSSSRSVASVDVDNDGQLELLVANNNARFQLFKNDLSSSHNWVGFVLPSPFNHIDKLELSSGDLTQTKQVGYKQSLFSQSDPRIHFGLGAYQKSLDLTIHDRQGSQVRINNIKVNQYYQLSANLKSVAPISYSADHSKLEALIWDGDEKQANHLFTISTIKGNRHEQLLAWTKMTADDQIRALKKLNKAAPPITEALVKLSLQSNDEPLVLQAIALVQSKEWDWSINWLLPLLKKSSTQIRCEVAQTFQQMFNEEEAALRYKFHTVSPLLQALESSNDEEKSCLLDALAASESKRAVGGILPLITPNHNLSVKTKASAVRALGLIRDSSTTMPIIETLRTSNSAEVIASALVALSRLAYQPQDIAPVKPDENKPNLLLLLESTKINTTNKLKVIEWLQTNQDGLVFSASELRNTSETLMDQITALNASTPLMKQAYRVLAADKGLPIPPYLSSQIQQPEFMPESVIALTQHNIANITSPVDRMVQQTDNRLIETFKIAKELHISLPSHLINELMTQTRTTALNRLMVHTELLSNYQLRTIIQYLLEHSFDNSPAQNQPLNHLIDSAIERNVSAIQLENIPDKMPPKVTLSYLNWFYQRTPFPNNAKQQLLRARVLTHLVLQSPTISKTEKMSLLTHASQRDVELLNTLLYNDDDISTPDLLSLISNVEQPKPSNDLRNTVKRVIASSNSPLEHKLSAAAILSQFEPDNIDKVLDEL